VKSVEQAFVSTCGQAVAVRREHRQQDDGDVGVDPLVDYGLATIRHLQPEHEAEADAKSRTLACAVEMDSQSVIGAGDDLGMQNSAGHETEDLPWLRPKKIEGVAHDQQEFMGAGRGLDGPVAQAGGVERPGELGHQWVQSARM
jgi:hypothetical protein